MDSGMISQIEKARLYASEPERVTFNEFNVTFEGNHNIHTVTYKDGQWHSTAEFFHNYGVCSHTMALERLLKDSVKPAQYKKTPHNSSLITQVEKSKFYENEPQRVTFNMFNVTFEGDNHTHTVTYDNGQWHSTSNYFKMNGVCAHIMTLERLLGNSVKPAEPVYA